MLNIMFSRRKPGSRGRQGGRGGAKRGGEERKREGSNEVMKHVLATEQIKSRVRGEEKIHAEERDEGMMAHNKPITKSPSRAGLAPAALRGILSGHTVFTNVQAKNQTLSHRIYVKI